MNEYEHKQAFNERYRYIKGKMTRMRIALLTVLLFPLCTVLFSFKPPIRLVSFIAAALGALVLCENMKSSREELKTLNSYAAGVILEQKLSSVENYDPFSMINSDVVGRLYLPMEWNGGNGSDLVEGTYRGVPLCFSDVKLTNTVSDSDGDSTTNTTFKGQVFMLSMKQPVHGRVWIGKVPLFSRRAQERRIGIEIIGVEALEDQNIYATTSIDANEILTDSYLPMLRDAFNRVDGKLYLCFDGDTLYGALYNKSDLFEGKGSAEWEALVNQNTDELDDLLRLIDLLTNNPALFARTDAA